MPPPPLWYHWLSPSRKLECPEGGAAVCWYEVLTEYPQITLLLWTGKLYVRLWEPRTVVMESSFQVGNPTPWWWSVYQRKWWSSCEQVFHSVLPAAAGHRAQDILCSLHLFPNGPHSRKYRPVLRFPWLVGKTAFPLSSQEPIKKCFVGEQEGLHIKRWLVLLWNMGNVIWHIW